MDLESTSREPHRDVFVLWWREPWRRPGRHDVGVATREAQEALAPVPARRSTIRLWDRRNRAA